MESKYTQRMTDVYPYNFGVNTNKYDPLRVIINESGVLQEQLERRAARDIGQLNINRIDPTIASVINYIDISNKFDINKLVISPEVNSNSIVTESQEQFLSHTVTGFDHMEEIHPYGLFLEEEIAGISYCFTWDKTQTIITLKDKDYYLIYDDINKEPNRVAYLYNTQDWDHQKKDEWLTVEREPLSLDMISLLPVQLKEKYDAGTLKIGENVKVSYIKRQPMIGEKFTDFKIIDAINVVKPGDPQADGIIVIKDKIYQDLEGNDIVIEDYNYKLTDNKIIFGDERSDYKQPVAQSDVPLVWFNSQNALTDKDAADKLILIKDKSHLFEMDSEGRIKIQNDYFLVNNEIVKLQTNDLFLMDLENEYTFAINGLFPDVENEFITIQFDNYYTTLGVDKKDGSLLLQVSSQGTYSIQSEIDLRKEYGTIILKLSLNILQVFVNDTLVKEIPMNKNTHLCTGITLQSKDKSTFAFSDILIYKKAIENPVTIYMLFFMNNANLNYGVIKQNFNLEFISQQGVEVDDSNNVISIESIGKSNVKLLRANYNVDNKYIKVVDEPFVMGDQTSFIKVLEFVNNDPISIDNLLLENFTEVNLESNSHTIIAVHKPNIDPSITDSEQIRIFGNTTDRRSNNIIDYTYGKRSTKAFDYGIWNYIDIQIETQIGHRLEGMKFTNNLVVVHDNTKLWYTADLKRWNLIESKYIVPEEIYDIVKSEQFWVMSIKHPTYNIIYSEDGINWSGIKLPEIFDEGFKILSLSYSDNKWVAVGENGYIYTCSALDSWNWINYKPLEDEDIFDVTHGGGLFVCVTKQGSLAYSSNGNYWWKNNTSFGGEGERLTGVNYTSGLFTICGHDGLLAYSYDGKVWELEDNPPFTGDIDGIGNIFIPVAGVEKKVIVIHSGDRFAYSDFNLTESTTIHTQGYYEPNDREIPADKWQLTAITVDKTIGKMAIYNNLDVQYFDLNMREDISTSGYLGISGQNNAKLFDLIVVDRALTARELFWITYYFNEQLVMSLDIPLLDINTDDATEELPNIVPQVGPYQPDQHFTSNYVVEYDFIDKQPYNMITTPQRYYNLIAPGEIISNNEFDSELKILPLADCTMTINVIPADATVKINGITTNTYSAKPYTTFTYQIDRVGYISKTEFVAMKNIDWTLDIELEKQTYLIKVITYPSDAIPLINNVPISAMKLKYNDEYTLTVIGNEHYVPYQETFTVTKDFTHIVNLKLIPIQYTLTINPNPAESDVYINGQHTNSIQIEENSRYTYIVNRDGYYSQSDTDYITEDTTINIELVPKTKIRLKINTDHEDAVIVINDYEQSQCMYTVGDSYYYTVTLDGYITESGSGIIMADMELIFVLTESNNPPANINITVNPIPLDSKVIINGVEQLSAELAYGSTVTIEISRNTFVSQTIQIPNLHTDQTIDVILNNSMCILDIVPNPIDSVVFINGEQTRTKTFLRNEEYSFVVSRQNYNTYTSPTYVIQSSITRNISLIGEDHTIAINAVDGSGNPITNAVYEINGEERNVFVAHLGTQIHYKISAEHYLVKEDTLTLNSDLVLDIVMEEQPMQTLVVTGTYTVDGWNTLDLYNSYDRIESIEWGDGSTELVSLDNIRYSHTYPGNGTYSLHIVFKEIPVAPIDSSNNVWEWPLDNVVVYSSATEMNDPLFAGIQHSSDVITYSLNNLTTINANTGLSDISTQDLIINAPNWTTLTGDILNMSAQNNIILNVNQVPTGQPGISMGNTNFQYLIVPDNLVDEFKITAPWSQIANKIYTEDTIPVPPPLPPLSSYLTFTSPEAFSIATILDNYLTTNYGISSNRTMEYSTDTTTWNSWDGQPISVSAGNNIYIRGTITADGSGSLYTNFTFPTGTSISCTGDIRSLDDYTNPENVTLRTCCYYSMFFGCTQLIQIPVLPATTLASNCYCMMFYGCTSLTQAPELPATTLADSCYGYMFRNCTSLIQPPELPATTLADSCYTRMFMGCLSLTNSPDLPATTLANYCYANMFDGCTSLTQLPTSLPAMTLADRCYQYMFRDCISLTHPPELPATALAQSCYFRMFMNCLSLIILPALPATTLANGCYTDMFNNCTSLTYPSVLPASILTSGCYENMFQGCTSLKISTTQTGIYNTPWRIPTNGTGTEAIYWGLNMLFGTGGTFRGNPVINTTYYYPSTIINNNIVFTTDTNTTSVTLSNADANILPYIQSIDWGDGDTTLARNHTYTTPGTYTIVAQLVNNLTTIGDTFLQLITAKSIILNAPFLTNIGYAFLAATETNSIILNTPNLTNIGQAIFYYSRATTISVELTALQIPLLTQGPDFSNINSFKVPANLVETYKNTDPWSLIADVYSAI